MFWLSSSVMVTTVTAVLVAVASITNAALMDISDYGDFERRVLNNDRPVIVGLTSKHCMACNLVMDDLKNIVAQRPAVDLAMVDVLNEPLADEVTVRRFSRRIIPNVIGFRSGLLIGEAEDHGTHSLRRFVESVESARLVISPFSTPNN